MIRLVFCPVLLLMLCSAAHAERLLHSHSVIYREATDDYLFRARFTYEPDFVTLVERPPPATGMVPESSLAFGIREDAIFTPGDWSTTTGMLRTRDAWQTGEASLIIFAPPFPEVASIPFDSEGPFFSAVVSRSDILAIGVDKVLFEYNISVSRAAGESFESDFRSVQLNVPEPSTTALVIGTLVPLGIFFRRRSRCREAHQLSSLNRCS